MLEIPMLYTDFNLYFFSVITYCQKVFRLHIFTVSYFYNLALFLLKTL